MVSNILLASGLVASVSAVDWALLVAGSNTFDNYRHQADLCNMYYILVANGLSKDRIITMAYDDIAYHAKNQFPGKMFNAPDKTGLGFDVYEGCNLDYTGSDVTVQNFLGLLSGEGTTGGNGRMLDSTADDDVFVFYVDHGAPGLIQFPGLEVLPASDFQVALASMHANQRYGNMVFYMEACESGSMFENVSTDINLYAVTAVGPDEPSLGTYCGYDAYINNTYVGSCLGDLFAVNFMKFVQEGDGSKTLNTMFQDVKGDVASYAALHWGHEINYRYGDLSMGELLVSQFFYGEGMKSILPSTTAPPARVYSARWIDMFSEQFKYNEDANTAPRQKHKGISQFHRIQQSSSALRLRLEKEAMAVDVYWNLAFLVFGDEGQVDTCVNAKYKPAHPECEAAVHNALRQHCAPEIELSSAFALQFHQVVVNLCNTELSWSTDLQAGEAMAAAACQATKDKYMGPTRKDLLV